MAIARVSRLRVETYSEDIIKKALNKSIEGNNYIQKASQVRPNGQLLANAVECFGEAINIYSRFVDPYLGISWIYHISGDNEKAIAFIMNALSIEPTHSIALELLDKYKNALKEKTISTAANKALDVQQLKQNPVQAAKQLPQNNLKNSNVVKNGYPQTKTVVAKGFLSAIKQKLF